MSLLQNQIMLKLMENIQLGHKIRNDSNITIPGHYALDATEKNKNISGTLAALVDNLSIAVATQRTRVDNLTATGTSLSDGELLDIRVGVDGRVYPTAGTAIRQQILTYRDVHSGVLAPTDCFAKVWIDTSAATEADGFMVPEIRDDITNSIDTWSSSKIQNVINALTKDIAISDETPDDAAKLWIDTARVTSADFAMLPEIRDDIVSAIDTWSSSKIKHEIDTANTDVQIGEEVNADAKVWIDTSVQSTADFTMLPEIRDDLISPIDTWSSSKIQNVINALTKDVYVGTDDPTSDMTKIWIDTNNPQDSFWLPQINDNLVSTVDTWSSSKIQSEFTKIRRELGLDV